MAHGPHDNAHTTDHVSAGLDRSNPRTRARAPGKCQGGCKGTGWTWAEGPAGDVKVQCLTCNAKGERHEEPASSMGPKVLACPGRCRGSGQVYIRIDTIGDRLVPCPACRPKEHAEALARAGLRRKA